MKVVKTLFKLIAVLLLVAIAGIAIAVSYSKSCPAPDAASAVSNGVTVVRYHCYGGPEVLALEEVEKPVPGDQEVLVKVHSAGVNPLDWHYLRGSPYLMRLVSGIGAPRERRIGVDFAGTIEAVGKDVSRFAVGDAVFGGRTGAFGEYINVREASAIAHIPPNISFDQAAAVGIAGVSALQALQDKGQLQAGQKVLVNGASGGVGTFAVQIAKVMGAEVTGVSSPRNHQLVRSLGASHMIDYKTANYTEGSERYDLIVDMIGNHSPLSNSGVLTPQGRLVIVGGSKGNWIGPLLGPLSVMVQSPLIDQEVIILMALLTRESIEELAELMAIGAVVPAIGSIYPLQDIQDALALSESGRASGKIIVSGIETLSE